MKLILSIAVAFLIALSFWRSVQYSKEQIYTELSANQKITLKAQKDTIKSLKNQVEYINSTNASYGKKIILETENENNRAKKTLMVRRFNGMGR